MFTLLAALYAAFQTFLLVILVLLVVLVLLLFQAKKRKETEQLMAERRKALKYCRNCGRPLETGRGICIQCGVYAGMGQNYCPRCGNQTDPLAVVCVNCGVSLNSLFASGGSGKSKIAAGLMGIFLGAFGIHNFYLGYKWKALAQLLMTILSGGILLVVVAIWGIIEGILILAGVIQTDADGVLLKG